MYLSHDFYITKVVLSRSPKVAHIIHSYVQMHDSHLIKEPCGCIEGNAGHLRPECCLTGSGISQAACPPEDTTTEFDRLARNRVHPLLIICIMHQLLPARSFTYETEGVLSMKQPTSQHPDVSD